MKLFSSANIRNILAWLIKLGTLGFNLPATMGVAALVVKRAVDATSNTFTLNDTVLTYVLGISGIIVIDAVFLGSWFDLDTNKTQDDTDKLVDALVVALMYILTIVIGIIHGEGWGGFIFRIPMGISVAKSTWKTISASVRRASSGDTKNIPLPVRWEQVVAVIKKGTAEVKSDLNNYIAELNARDEVIAKHREARQLAGIEVVNDMQPIYQEQAVTTAKNSQLTMVVPSLVSQSKVVTPTIVDTNIPAVNTTTPASKVNYSIYKQGKVWKATCLEPGCSKLVEGTTEGQARRMMTGHQNKHRYAKNIAVVEEGTVISEVSTTPEMHVNSDESAAVDPASRFQPRTDTPDGAF